MVHNDLKFRQALGISKQFRLKIASGAPEPPITRIPVGLLPYFILIERHVVRDEF